MYNSFSFFKEENNWRIDNIYYKYLTTLKKKPESKKKKKNAKKLKKKTLSESTRTAFLPSSNV